MLTETVILPFRIAFDFFYVPVLEKMNINTFPVSANYSYTIDWFINFILHYLLFFLSVKHVGHDGPILAACCLEGKVKMFEPEHAFYVAASY